MRKYLRQVAKARLKALGVGQVNREMSCEASDGLKMWKSVLFGEYAQDGENALRVRKARRKIRRVRA